MNVSIYDNVDTPENLSKSFVFRKLNDLNVNIDFEVRIFCPLCTKSFSFKFRLFEHLRIVHENFLNQVSSQTLRFIECPFCSAKFYGRHLIAKHALHHHSKVIKALFINKIRFKCYFCDENLNEKDHCGMLKHFEEYHFLDFEEEFNKIFSCDTTQEMSVSEIINSVIKNGGSHSASEENVCMKISKHPKNDSVIPNFDEASKINCYDFTDLKQQLENLKDLKSKNKSMANSTNKSILKDVRNCTILHRSARRVLRFDVPSDSDYQENLAINKKFSVLKKCHLEQLDLICNDKPNFFVKSNGTFCDEPQHASTPNSRSKKTSDKDKTKKIYCKSSFKSFINEKNEFEFKCGKCRLLFKENLELVSHVKTNHRKFSLNAFQPCYHCAICNARFYKNCYLRKHHDLHKPY